MQKSLQFPYRPSYKKMGIKSAVLKQTEPFHYCLAAPLNACVIKADFFTLLLFYAKAQ